jgi:hypothetical protein
VNKFKNTIEVDDAVLAQDLYWATKVAKEDDTFKFLSYAIVRNGTVTVTDKTRIHRVSGFDKEMIPNGNYAILACSPDRVILALPENELKDKVPNFDGIFDTKKPSSNFEFECSNDKVVMALEYAKLIRSFPKPTAISYDAVRALGASETKYSVAWYSPEDPVFFTLGNKQSAIMPIRME